MTESIQPIRVGILGAASYSAGKLIDLLSDHPYAEITYLVSTTFGGAAPDKCHDFLKDVCDIPFSRLPKEPSGEDLSELLDNCDLVVMSKPHDYAHKIMKHLKNSSIKVIDLSGDFRLKDPALYERKEYYGYMHKEPLLLKDFVYGLPELYREQISRAQWVANPGCYPTSAILGLAPLLSAGLIEGKGIIIDSISGASGAGKSPKKSDAFMFINLTDNIRPYRIGNHQHTPEIEQELTFSHHGKDVQVLFSPSVGGFKSGIISTMYSQLVDSNTTWEDVYACFQEKYEEEVFVRVFGKDESGGDHYPALSQVVDTNFCDIGFHLDKRTNHCIVISSIDNTIKGAAGQAIQNLNIMFGFPEETGLPRAAAIGRRKKKRTNRNG